MAGYIRQSTFVDGDTITAALFNNEYNQLVNAFSNTSGHKHDGTTAEGPVIGLIGDAGETSPNNKVLIDTTNNYIEFYVEVSSAPVQQLYIADGAIIPVTDSDIDLGTTSLRFKDTYTDTVTTTGNVSIGGDLTVTGSATISGNLTFGDADTDSINLAAEIDSDIIPNTDGTYDLGSATKEWQDLYIDGTANIDSLVADTADINGGTIDGATIATSDITVGAGKTLDVSAGTLTLANDQISGDKVEGGTIAATTITTLTSTTGNITNVNATTVDSTNLEVTNLKAKDGTAAGSIADSTGVVTLASSVLTTTDINGGTIDGVTIGGSSAGAVTFTDLSDGTITITAFADEDDMSSDSATLVPTQQSVKAYVDSQVTAQDLDFQGDTGGALSIDLDSESLTIAGGTGIDTSGATNTLTVAIDSTVATLTGTQTLTNKTLTSPDVNTPDIDGGTIDGTVIGGATPAAGTFTTLTANTSLTGTLATAAQPNITSLGTLTSLTSSSNITVSNSSGHGSIELGGSSGGFIDLKTPASDDFDARIIYAGSNLQLLTNADEAILLRHNSSTKLATTSTGIDVTGTVTADGLTVDGNVQIADAQTLYFSGTGGDYGAINYTDTDPDVFTMNFYQNSVFSAGMSFSSISEAVGGGLITLKTGGTNTLKLDNNGDISFYEDTGTTAQMTWDASADALTFTDSSKAIFGAGSDLQIYHDGSNSYIEDAGTGSLIIEGTDLNLRANDNSRYLVGTDGSGGSTALYHPDGDSIKLATTSTGIDVTGTLTTDGLTVVGSDSNIRYDVASSNPHTNPTLHLENQNATDGNVAALMLSADNANGVGGSAYIYAQSETTNQKGNLVFAREDGANTPVTSMKLSSNGDISFYEDTGTTAKLFWDASAESLGIGTTSPSVALEISDSTANAILRLTRNDTIITAGNQIGALEFAGADADDAGVSAKIIAEAESGAGQTALAMYTGTPSALSERLRIDKDGNVGIGTTPSHKLHIDSNGSSNSVIRIDADDNRGASRYAIDLVDSDANSRGSVRISTTSGPSIITTGSVGIGQSSPAALLHIGDSTNSLGGTAGDQLSVLTLESDTTNTDSLLFTTERLSTGTTWTSAAHRIQRKVDASKMGYIQFGSQTDDLITFGKANNEYVRIDSSGNVGIGTSSPQGNLHVVGASGNAGRIYLSDDDNGTGAGDSLLITKSGTSASIYNRDSGNLNLGSNDDNDMVVINSSGNVGIGTSSPDHELTVGDANAETTIGVAGSRSMFGFKSDLAVVQGGAGKGIQFNVNNNTFGSGEAMRIDSSGRLLVGTTSTAPHLFTSGKGFVINQGTFGIDAANNNIVGIFNRTETDGTVVEFKRDGTVVGSIGTKGGDLYVGTGVVGIRTHDSTNSIRPTNTNDGTARDAAIDLGASVARFKDLYLSGGAYIGGTGSANHLDDYEEGTWTPVTSSGSWTVGFATYTKVGNMVTCRFQVTATATISVNDFTGLPFTPDTNSSGICGYQNSESGEVFTILVQNSNVWNFRVASAQKGMVNGSQVFGMFSYSTTS